MYSMPCQHVSPVIMRHISERFPMAHVRPSTLVTRRRAHNTYHHQAHHASNTLVSTYCRSRPGTTLQKSAIRRWNVRTYATRCSTTCARHSLSTSPNIAYILISCQMCFRISQSSCAVKSSITSVRTVYSYYVFHTNLPFESLTTPVHII